MIIYLASPYSHEDRAVRQWRFDAVCKLAGRLMKRGHTIFAPIAHSHMISEHYDLPKGWSFWREHDFQFIAASSELWVAMFDGWQDSVGVTAEIAEAQRLGLPVVYIDPQAKLPGEVRTYPWFEAAPSA